MIIDFDTVANLFLELRIANIGATMARDVQFEFAPPPVTTGDEKWEGRGKLTELNIFTNGIPSLPPGKEIRIFFDHFPDLVKAELPTSYTVEMRYRGVPARSTATPPSLTSPCI